MTITNGYATLAQIKAPDRLNITDIVSDTPLENTITTVSREIDKYCGQYFYKTSTGSTDTRYFTAVESERLLVGGFVSVTALYTDSLAGDRSYPYTWATTDYDLFPYDAATLSEPEPYRWLDVTPRGQYKFPVDLAKGVKLTAVYGWPAVPAGITEACLLWSMRLHARYKTPLGISSMSALGQQTVKVPPPDKDVCQILDDYKWIAV
jgi:hypothetical protein